MICEIALIDGNADRNSIDCRNAAEIRIAVARVKVFHAERKSVSERILHTGTENAADQVLALAGLQNSHAPTEFSGELGLQARQRDATNDVGQQTAVVES